MIAAMHDDHLAREVGEEDRLLDGRVAAADDHDFLALVEEAVAGRARRDAVALERLLALDAEPARLRAGRDDQRVARVVIAGIALEPERTLRKIDLHDVVHDDLGADVLGLLAHLLHEPGPLDHVREARDSSRHPW